MASRPSASDLHRSFLEVVDQALVAHVAVFDPITFEPPVELPAGLVVNPDVRVTPIGAYMLVAPADQPGLLDQQSHIEDDGMVTNWVHFVSGSTGRACLFDLTERFGVQALVLSEEQEGAGSEEVSARPEVVGRITRWRTDSSAKFLSAEPTLTRLLGWTEEEFLAMSGIELTHPDDRRAAMHAWAGVSSGPGASDRARCRLRCADGAYLWMELTYENHLSDPGDNTIHTEALDISWEMAAADELRARERLLHRLAEALPVGVVQIDTDEQIVYANSGIGLITGRAGVATLAEQLQDALDDDRVLATQAIAQVLGTGVDGDVEIRIAHKLTGEHRVCGLTLRALTEDDGTVTGAIVCVSDVTDNASRRHELEVAATFDTLTATYNRASCLAALEAALRRAAPVDAGCAVVFIDLDDFKAINDKLGHIAGDELLVETAERLRAATRATDVVGRFGGDEFVVVCADLAEPAQALELAGRIHERLTRPASIADHVVQPRASIGVAWASSEIGGDELLRRADVAMYAAKRDPRVGVHLYSVATEVVDAITPDELGRPAAPPRRPERD